jgi:hypothetical protein
MTTTSKPNNGKTSKLFVTSYHRTEDGRLGKKAKVKMYLVLIKHHAIKTYK